MTRPARWPFLAALAAFAAAVGLLTAFALWRMQVDEVASGFEASALQSRNLEALVTHSLHTAQQVAASALPDAQDELDAGRFVARLIPSLRHVPFLRSVSLLDAQGQVVASSNPANLGLRIDTASYFPQAQAQQVLLRIGPPWAGRDFADGRAASALNPDDGDVPGFVAAQHQVMLEGRPMSVLYALNSDYFVNLGMQAVGAPPSSVTVVRYDGMVLMSTDPGMRAGTMDPVVMRALGRAEVETDRLEENLADGRQSLTTLRASRLYPLFVVTRLDRDQVMQHWWTEARTLAAVELPSLAAISLVTAWLYRRRLQWHRQSEEAQHQQRLHATVFSASTEGIFITDRFGRILSINPAFTRITGYAPADVVGETMWALVPKDLPASARQQVRGAIEQHGSWQGELASRRKDGSPFDALVSIATSNDEQGQLQHIIVDVADITERKLAQQALRVSEERFRSLTGLSSDWYWEQDAQFRFVQLQGQLEAKTGISAAAHVGLRRWDMPALNMSEADWDAHRAILNSHLPFRGLELRRPDKGGREHWVSISGTPVFDSQGRFAGYRGVGTDITERKRAEMELRLAASVFTHSREAILITDIDGTILDVNEAFAQITGYARPEVIGRNPRLLGSGSHGPEFFATFWASLKRDGHWQGELWNRRKSGELYAVMLTISVVRDPQGQARQYVALFSDITASKEHERNLEHIAHYDALTSLPNRLLLADRLHQALAQARRRGSGIAVAYLDLDGFKAVNDRHGHGIGDGLLRELATQMKSALREGDTLARIGGDEFVAVLIDLKDNAPAMPVLDRLLSAAAGVAVVEGRSLQVSASVGVTFSPPGHDMDAEQLLRQADQAMYQAKLSGKNRIHVFNDVVDRSLRGRHASLARLRVAMATGELMLRYQPKVNLRNGTLVGAEALIRWQHPEHGLLLPASFMPMTEEDPLGIELGEWIIDRALTDLAVWQDAGLKIPVSINIGARQLQHADFLERLQVLLARHPLAAHAGLELEMLESSALEDLTQVSKVIEACKALGISFAIDDFGTGYSSLTYLKGLPVRHLKIDQSFVRGMLADPDDLAILVGVIDLASAFGRETIAEGVETLDHGRALLQLGCELAQGNAIAQPMSAEALVRWAADWRPDPSWASLRQAGRSGRSLLFAITELRAEGQAVQAYLCGARETPPTLDPSASRLGAWLERMGPQNPLEPKTIDAIRQLHAQWVDQAKSACNAGPGASPVATGDSSRAAELGDLCARLVGQAEALVQQLGE